MVDTTLIEQIERERKNQEAILARAEALWRLMQNDDFKLVFRDYYQGLYLQRIVKEDLATATAEITKQSAVDRIKSIGLFDQFIKQLDAEGVYAKSFMSASDEELVEAYNRPDLRGQYGRYYS